MKVFVTITDVRTFKTSVRPRNRRQSIVVCFLVLSVVSFVSGFIVGRPFINESEVPNNYRAEQRGDRFFAVKHRGGENPPSFEIDEKQYRLWKQGEAIHSLLHFGACASFLVAWITLAFAPKNERGL
jgi:hypothetical protein